MQENYPTVSWATEPTGDHTAANVPVYAWGVNSQMICGTMDNTNMFEVCTADADCFASWHQDYPDWVALDKPNCWCGVYGNPQWPYQCDGDADNLTQGLPKYRVYTNDFNIMVDNWKKPPTDPTFNPCADFDHKPQGVPEYRVYTNDFNILVGNWKMTDEQLPGNCYRCESYQEAQGKSLTSQELVKWLEQIWLDEEVQKLIDKDVLLKFIESLKEDL